MSFDLAQVNVSRLLAPLESPQLAPYMAALDEDNAAGDAAPRFQWRLQTEGGNATAVKAFGWDVAGSHGVIVNLTTWQSVEALAGFVFSGRHLEIMRQRRRWFHQAAEATTAMWWVPRGHRPTTDEAEDRVRQLRDTGLPPTASRSASRFRPQGRQPRTCTPAGCWGGDRAAPRRDLACEAVKMAVSARGGAGQIRGVVLHTDRGSTYTASDFIPARPAARNHPVDGPVGSCFDNAAAEAFFSSLE